MLQVTNRGSQCNQDILNPHNVLWILKVLPSSPKYAIGTQKYVNPLDHMRLQKCHLCKLPIIYVTIQHVYFISVFFLCLIVPVLLTPFCNRVYINQGLLLLVIDISYFRAVQLSVRPN